MFVDYADELAPFVDPELKNIVAGMDLETVWDNTKLADSGHILQRNFDNFGPDIQTVWSKDDMARRDCDFATLCKGVFWQTAIRRPSM